MEGLEGIDAEEERMETLSLFEVNVNKEELKGNKY